MHCSTAGALEKVIYARYYEKLITMLLQMDKTFVGVNHLLQVYLLINHMHKRILSIILAVNAVQLLNVYTTTVANMPRVKSPR